MNPELYGPLMERLFEYGAIDVTLLPVYMKKNRPGTQIQVLCHLEGRQEIMELIFNETTTIDLRYYIVVPEKRDYELQAVQSKVMAVFFRIVWKVKNSSLKRKQKNTRSSFRMLKPHAARSALILSPATPLR